jgi:tRNA (guanosine-2'-O-)-methyltransferase
MGVGNSVVELSAQERVVLGYLQGFLTDRRQERIAEVLGQRTRYLTVVLENLFQEHNISAVLRTCDAFGVQDVGVIETDFEYAISRQVALGSDQWLTIRRFPGPSPTRDCLTDLRARGYRLVATTPRPGSVPISEIPLDRPIALLMGSEIDGLSEEALAMADLSAHLPMHGFVESFNISVATALCVQTLTQRIRESSVAWGLSEPEQLRLTLDWTRKSIRNVEAIEARFARERLQN